MRQKSRQKGRIILPANLKPRPEKHEINVASILAMHFGKDINFVKRANRPTADFLIDDIYWELKSPTGTGRNTIQRQLQDASHQSLNVIIDSSRSKMHGNKIRSQVEFQFKKVSKIKRLIFISRNGNVSELKK